MATYPLRLWDAVALLTLFDEVNKISTVSGNLFVQKMTFLAELAGKRDSLRVGHFRFFRFKLGPYSAQLAEGVAKLEAAEAITLGRTLTKRGKYILEYAGDSIAASPRARNAIQVIEKVADEHGRKSGEQLRAEIYKMRVHVVDFNQEMLVDDIPRGADIIDPAKDHNLAEVDPFDADTTEELMAELRMPMSVLDESTHEYQGTVNEGLERLRTACL